MKFDNPLKGFLAKLLRRRQATVSLNPSVPAQESDASMEPFEEEYPDDVTRLIFSSTRLVRVRLLGQEFCVEPSKVVATFDGIPGQFKGAMLYENHVIPLVDLRMVSDCSFTPETAATLVVMIQSQHVGLVVEALPKHMQVPFSHITLATEDSNQLYPFLDGEIRMEDSFLSLISMERLLAPRLAS